MTGLPEPAPTISIPVAPVIEPQDGTRAFWPGIAWWILFTEYYRSFGSRENSTFSWMRTIPINVRRKPDSEGNMWEVRPTPDGMLVLTRTASAHRLQAAQVAIDSVVNNISKTMRDYFEWKRKLPERIAEGSEPHSIKEAQQMVETLREELEMMRNKHEEASAILNSASVTEYVIDPKALAGMLEYDIPLSVVTTKPPVQKAQVLDFPDLDSDYVAPRPVAMAGGY